MMVPLKLSPSNIDGFLYALSFALAVGSGGESVFGVLGGGQKPEPEQLKSRKPVPNIEKRAEKTKTENRNRETENRPRLIKAKTSLLFQNSSATLQARFPHAIPTGEAMDKLRMCIAADRKQGVTPFQRGRPWTTCMCIESDGEDESRININA